jgi:hypothetical protein
MITDEPKNATLRIDCGFVVERAVLEVVYQARSDPISVRDLNQVTISNVPPFQCMHH